MKKTFFYAMMMVLTAMTFTACGDDEPEPAKAPTLKTQTYTEQAASISLSSQAAPYSYMEFTEGGRAVLKLRKVSSFVKSRAQEDLLDYIAGTFAWDGNKYTIYDTGGKIICTVQTAKLSSGKVSVHIEMPDGQEFDGEGTLASKSSASATTDIARSWKVTSTRIRHEGAVTGARDFQGCDLNEILNYAKGKATINESFTANKKVTEVVLTRSGSFFIFYANDENDYGTWQWRNAQEGTISYKWREADMGNKFESGTATFDVRKGQYALTLSADIDDDSKGEYNISITFYLAEK